MRRNILGFSLIELIFTIVLLGILSSMMATVLMQFYASFAISQNSAEVDIQTVIALERLVNDIHTIRSRPDITTMGGTSFAFTNTAGATVTYQLSGTTLLRNGLVLASGVQSFSLGYLDSTGAATGQAVSLRYITIVINEVQGNITSSISTLAALRV